MTAIKDVGMLAHLDADNLLMKSPLWCRSVESITEEELISFIKRHDLKGQGAEARMSVAALLSELRSDIAEQKISGATVEFYSVAEPSMTLTDLNEIMGCLPKARGDAVLFALATDLSLDDVTAIRWKPALKLVRGRPIAARVLSMVARHIRTDLVFWEYQSGRLSPLFDLKGHFESVTNGKPFEVLKREYQSMTPIDFSADYVMMRESSNLLNEVWGG